MTEEQWAVKRVDLFIDLLYAMSKCLGYDFDKTHIKNLAYAPTAHGKIEEADAKMRDGFVELLEGKRVLRMELTNLSCQNIEQLNNDIK
jgi:hypothetical protein